MTQKQFGMWGTILSIASVASRALGANSTGAVISLDERFTPTYVFGNNEPFFEGLRMNNRILKLAVVFFTTFTASAAMADRCAGGTFHGADGVIYQCKELTLEQACTYYPACRWIIEDPKTDLTEQTELTLED